MCTRATLSARRVPRDSDVFVDLKIDTESPRYIDFAPQSVQSNRLFSIEPVAFTYYFTKETSNENNLNRFSLPSYHECPGPCSGACGLGLRSSSSSCHSYLV